MTLYMGIDGGGTSTRAVVADATGRVRGIGKGEGSNPNASGVDGSAAALRTAAEAALHHAHATPDQVAATFVGMAGVVGKEDLELGRSIAAKAGLRNFDIDHDIRIALAGGLAGAEGLALIVGTGSSCYGRTADGRSCQAGGWGSILDDGGSAYGLGLAAMKAAVRIADGRLPDSVLLHDVMAALELTEIRQIVRKVYQTGMSKSEVGQLAPVVISAWERGDAVAADLVDEGVRELVWIVQTAGKRLGLLERIVRVTAAGGLIENSATYRQRVFGGLKDALPTGSHVGLARLAPVLGAVLLAYDQAAVPHDTGTHDRLKSTYEDLATDAR